jgi:hypothetical protein
MWMKIVWALVDFVVVFGAITTGYMAGNDGENKQIQQIVAVVVILITIWATLKMVFISIEIMS